MCDYNFPSILIVLIRYVVLGKQLYTIQGSYSHEKSCFFPSLEKSWKLGKLQKLLQFSFPD